MPHYHVLAKTNATDKFRCLFADLSEQDLRKKFVTFYERGKAFLAGNDLVSPSAITSLQIICTNRKSKTEINLLRAAYNARMDKYSDSFVVLGLGDYGLEDIGEAGEDVTHTFIKGPPGSKSEVAALLIKIAKPVAGFASALLIAYIIFKMGWN